MALVGGKIQIRTIYHLLEVYENSTYEIGMTQIIATKTYGTNSLFTLLTINGKNF